MRAGHGTLPPLWTRDGTGFRVLITERGNCRLDEISVDGSSVRTIVGGERVLLDTDGCGERIVFSASTPTTCQMKRPG